MRGLITIIFLAIAIGGWIVNLINSQNHPPPPNRRRRDNRDGGGKVQSEIEQFLDEARRARQARQGVPNQVEGIEVVEEGRRRPPANQKSREQIWREQTEGRRQESEDAVVRQQIKRSGQSKPRKQQPTQKKASPASQSPGQSLAASQTNLQSQQLGAGISKVVESRLPHAVDQGVQTHLGVFTAESPDSSGQQAYRQTKTGQSQAIRDLQKLLTSSSGARNAIILSEILKPPLSRRDRRS